MPPCLDPVDRFAIRMGEEDQAAAAAGAAQPGHDAHTLAFRLGVRVGELTHHRHGIRAVSDGVHLTAQRAGCVGHHGLACGLPVPRCRDQRLKQRHGSRPAGIRRFIQGLHRFHNDPS